MSVLGDRGRGRRWVVSTGTGDGRARRVSLAPRYRVWVSSRLKPVETGRLGTGRGPAVERRGDVRRHHTPVDARSSKLLALAIRSQVLLLVPRICNGLAGERRNEREKLTVAC